MSEPEPPAADRCVSAPPEGLRARLDESSRAQERRDRRVANRSLAVLLLLIAVAAYASQSGPPGAHIGGGAVGLIGGSLVALRLWVVVRDD